MPNSLVEAQGIHVVVEGTVVDSSYKDQSTLDDSFLVYFPSESRQFTYGSVSERGRHLLSSDLSKHRNH